MCTGLLRLTIALLTFAVGVGLTNLVPNQEKQITVLTAQERALVNEISAAEDALHAARLANDQTAYERLDQHSHRDRVLQLHSGKVRIITRPAFRARCNVWTQ